jgi:hypothetical protein
MAITVRSLYKADVGEVMPICLSVFQLQKYWTKFSVVYTKSCLSNLIFVRIDPMQLIVELCRVWDVSSVAIDPKHS